MTKTRNTKRRQPVKSKASGPRKNTSQVPTEPRRNLPPVPEKKLNEAMLAKLSKLVRAGHYQDTAASLCGIDRQTFFRWMKLGRRNPADNPMEARLCHTVDQAEALFEGDALARLEKAGEKDWRAIAWRLERRAPSRWSKVEKHETTGANGGPVQVQPVPFSIDASKLTTEELLEMERLLSKATVKPPPQQLEGAQDDGTTGLDPSFADGNEGEDRTPNGDLET